MDTGTVSEPSSARALVRESFKEIRTRRLHRTVPFIRSIVCFAFVICLSSLVRSAIASNLGYPIPFDKREDISGNASEYPSGPRGLALKTYGLKLPWVILVHRTVGKAILSEDAAQLAYKTVFLTIAQTRYPRDGEYVVVVLFGPKGPQGIHYVAFIFARNAAGHWKARLVTTPDELRKIVYVVFRSPNWRPTFKGTPSP
jgi:hypothetical protein